MNNNLNINKINFDKYIGKYMVMQNFTMGDNSFEYHYFEKNDTLEICNFEFLLDGRSEYQITVNFMKNNKVGKFIFMRSKASYILNIMDSIISNCKKFSSDEKLNILKTPSENKECLHKWRPRGLNTYECIKCNFVQKIDCVECEHEFEEIEGAPYLSWCKYCKCISYPCDIEGRIEHLKKTGKMQR